MPQTSTHRSQFVPERSIKGSTRGFSDNIQVNVWLRMCTWLQTHSALPNAQTCRRTQKTFLHFRNHSAVIWIPLHPFKNSPLVSLKNGRAAQNCFDKLDTILMCCKPTHGNILLHFDLARTQLVTIEINLQALFL